MQKSNILTLGAAAVAAWIAYRWWVGGSILPSMPQGVNNPSGATTGGPPTLNERTLILAEAAKQGYGPASFLTFDEWNYFRRLYRNSDPPKGFEESGLADRQRKLTIDEFMFFSGLTSGGVAGLGWINFGPANRGWNVINTAVATGVEKMSKRFM